MEIRYNKTLNININNLSILNTIPTVTSAHKKTNNKHHSINNKIQK